MSDVNDKHHPSRLALNDGVLSVEYTDANGNNAFYVLQAGETFDAASGLIQPSGLAPIDAAAALANGGSDAQSQDAVTGGTGTPVAGSPSTGDTGTGGSGDSSTPPAGDSTDAGSTPSASDASSTDGGAGSDSGTGGNGDAGTGSAAGTGTDGSNGTPGDAGTSGSGDATSGGDQQPVAGGDSQDSNGNQLPPSQDVIDPTTGAGTDTGSSSSSGDSSGAVVVPATSWPFSATDAPTLDALSDWFSAKGIVFKYTQPLVNGVMGSPGLPMWIAQADFDNLIPSWPDLQQLVDNEFLMLAPVDLSQVGVVEEEDNGAVAANTGGGTGGDNGDDSVDPAASGVGDQSVPSPVPVDNGATGGGTSDQGGTPAPQPAPADDATGAGDSAQGTGSQDAGTPAADPSQGTSGGQAQTPSADSSTPVDPSIRPANITSEGDGLIDWFNQNAVTFTPTPTTNSPDGYPIYIDPTVVTAYAWLQSFVDAGILSTATVPDFSLGNDASGAGTVPAASVTPVPSPAPTPLVNPPSGTATGDVGRQLTETHINQIVWDLIKNCGQTAKNVVEAVYQYIANMRPGMPVDPAVGARHQTTMFRTFHTLFNRVENDFDPTYRAVLKLVESHSNGVFKETHRFRFLDQAHSMSDADKKAYMRWVTMMNMTAPIKGRQQVLKQIDIGLALKHGTSEAARQRVFRFYGK